MRSELRTLVGERIKNLREAKDWSQLQLATESGVDVSWIGQLERGQVKINLEKIEQICKALDLNLQEFFDTNRPEKAYSSVIERQFIGLVHKVPAPARRHLIALAKQLGKK